MAKNLVIVESPAKAKTIEKFLGSNYKVLSCYGHVRDLPKSQTSIDIANGYTPQYEVPNEKKKVVSELMKEAHAAECVWLASDEDREGEAIAWHLAEVLQLDPNKTKRIVFNEITKTAILKAIETPRQINLDLTNAQQARRVLDRLVGYEISPVLWKKVRPQLSAGRVQSVAVRLIVERENEIQSFASQSNFKVVANFTSEKNDTLFEAELNTRFESKELAHKFLEQAHSASYKVNAIDVRPTKRSPAAPFTTSTLQQEASRKLNFSVAKTMMVAQQLYEAGLITYMRTDSVHLSETALGMAKDVIENNYGSEYYKRRQFATKSKGAQEAHEAIRPAYMERSECEGDNQQRRLYELIWKRTVASQMSDAEFSKTQVDIEISNRKERFVAKGLVMLFNGFIKLYTEDHDDDEGNESKKVLPPLNENEALLYKAMKASQTFSSAPPRYSEASLVKKMEELGIGRPSTYAPTISTIQKREYVIKENKEGQERSYCILELKPNNGSINEKTMLEKFGSEKAKLFPTDIGSLVNQFLEEHFESIVDYNFTAEVEKEFDDVATGHQSWVTMIDRFYQPFHLQVTKTEKESEKVSGARLVGVDPKSGKNIYVKLGRFGAVAQIGETSDENKPTFAGLKKGQSINTITLDEVIDLFRLPRTVGDFEGEDMVVAIGRFGPYVRHNALFYPIPKTEDPFTVEHETLVRIIQERRLAESQRLIKSFDEHEDLRVLNGRFGPYISFEKKNYKIPKTQEPTALSYQDCLNIIQQAGSAPVKKSRKK